MALLASLAALVLTDAGGTSQVAWLGAGLAAVLLAAGMAVEAPAPVHLAVALLGVTFLVRHDTRLLLAPVYGAGLLLMDDLAIRTMELSGVSRIAPGVIGARVGATLAVAAAGACAAAVAALAVTGGPARSVALTALGALITVVAVGAIVRVARRRFRSSPVVQSPGAAGQSTSSKAPSA
ncbi:MAG TPA: hypothetical protein VEF89_33830 [Solirubrobacteraceae bacterium]|nr:hypothetical protein [Solirubrobacteraceae bacterium]